MKLSQLTLHSLYHNKYLYPLHKLLLITVHFGLLPRSNISALSVSLTKEFVPNIGKAAKVHSGSRSLPSNYKHYFSYQWLVNKVMEKFITISLHKYLLIFSLLSLSSGSNHSNSTVNLKSLPFVYLKRLSKNSN